MLRIQLCISVAGRAVAIAAMPGVVAGSSIRVDEGTFTAISSVTRWSVASIAVALVPFSSSDSRESA